jgi:hypothetical protein
MSALAEVSQTSDNQKRSILAWAVNQARDNAWVHMGILSMAVIACYFGLWNAYFWLDDYWMLGWVRFHETWNDAIWAEFGYSWRLLLDFILWTRVKLFGLNASLYYWTSLLQHLMVVGLVYWLASFWTGRRFVAFLAALLFGTSHAYYTVVTWIIGSNASLVYIPDLIILALFSLYLRRRKVGWYWASLVLYVLIAVGWGVRELPLILLAYHLIVGRHEKGGTFHWRELLLHLPYWVLFGVYVLVEIYFVQLGSSEATVADQVYWPGLHMVSNLVYLVYLVVPAYGHDILARFVGAAAGQVFHWLTRGGAVVGNLAAGYGLWKGSPLVRFAIAFVYLSFLPYTLWRGTFAGAIRYRYLPAIGFSIVLALSFTGLHEWLRRHKGAAWGWVVPVIVVAFLFFNMAVVQMWVQRHVENSELRRAFVTDLALQYAQVEPQSQIYIEVPDPKFIDLGSACELVFAVPPRCESFVTGERSLEAMLGAESEVPVYWLQATQEGLRQVYPE